MKRISNEEILDRIYDLADENGLRIDEFILKLEEDYTGTLPQLDGLPQEIVDELTEARESKKEHKRQERMNKSREDAEAEIKRFREIFPDVNAEDIPELVWEEVEKGATLSHAYALYKITEENLDQYAKGVNERNSKKSAKAGSDGSTEPVFTKETVERMSGKDVKKNYKNILNSLKNWKF